MNTLKGLQPGRDLDRTIATEVLKLQLVDEQIPHFSTETSAAFGLVEELCLDEIHGRQHFSLFMFTTHWKAMFGTPDINGGGAGDEVAELTPGSTAAMAICLAALTHIGWLKA